MTRIALLLIGIIIGSAIGSMPLSMLPLATVRVLPIGGISGYTIIFKLAFKYGEKEGVKTPTIVIPYEGYLTKADIPDWEDFWNKYGVNLTKYEKVVKWTEWRIIGVLKEVEGEVILTIKGHGTWSDRKPLLIYLNPKLKTTMHFKGTHTLKVELKVKPPKRVGEWILVEDDPYGAKLTIKIYYKGVLVHTAVKDCSLVIYAIKFEPEHEEKLKLAKEWREKYIEAVSKGEEPPPLPEALREEPKIREVPEGIKKLDDVVDDVETVMKKVIVGGEVKKEPVDDKVYILSSKTDTTITATREDIEEATKTNRPLAWIIVDTIVSFFNWLLKIILGK